MANSKKRKKQPKNMAKTEVVEKQPKKKTEVRSVSDTEEAGETSVKNLLIIIGIIILLIVALILAGLFVSSLTNQGSSSTDSSSTESVEGSVSSEGSASSEETATASSESVSSEETASSEESSSSASSSEASESTDTTVEGSVNGDGISFDMPTEFAYTAGNNEGVAHQARKAIRDYLEVTGNSLSLAQRLFMEVTLQNSHNPVYMEIGEGRIFTLGEMDSAFASASTLSSYQINAWQNQVNAAHYTGII